MSEPECELDQPIWALVSAKIGVLFTKQKYRSIEFLRDQAFQRLGDSSLCIITAEAARRMNGTSK